MAPETQSLGFLAISFTSVCVGGEDRKEFREKRNQNQDQEWSFGGSEKYEHVEDFLRHLRKNSKKTKDVHRPIKMD